MDRKDRQMSQRLSRARHAERNSAAIEKAMSGIGIPDSQKDTFLRWAMGSLWKDFTELRMNQRLIIENEIRNLGLRFPNGTVRKQYAACFSLPADRIRNVDIAGAGELGLTFSMSEDGNCSLTGMPAKAGDYVLRLRYETVDGEPASELSIPIAFNPNPRELWKNKPTDPNIPYFKPDMTSEYVKVEAGADGLPRKDIVAASQRGRSHAQEGKARDDDFRVHHCPESDWYVMAVADGAGSAKFSRMGSRVACDTVADHCIELLADNPDFEEAIHAFGNDRENTEKRTVLTKHVIDIIYGGAKKAHNAVKQTAELNGEARLKDFATTLMFAICKRFDFGWFIASFWVGDGAMCLYDDKKKIIKLLGTPDEGEFSGQTRFLTMPEIFRDKDVVSKRVRMTIVDDFTALYLMSDGVSDPMFETDRNLNDFGKWKEFSEHLRSGFPEDGIGGVELSDDNEKAAEQLLGWLDFWSPGNHDDRTIAILY